MVTEIAVTAGDLPDALSHGAAWPRTTRSRPGQPHMAASKPILPLVLQGRFDEALAQAASMWDAWQRAGRPPARWMGPAAYAAVLAHGLRGDDKGHDEWLARLSGDHRHRRAPGRRDLPGLVRRVQRRPDRAAPGAHRRRRWPRSPTCRWGRSPGTGRRTGTPRGPTPGRSPPRWPSWPSLPDATDRLAAAAPAGEENYWAAACLARAAGRLNGDHGALARSLAGWEGIDARFERACTLLLMDGRADEGARRTGRPRLSSAGTPKPLSPRRA